MALWPRMLEEAVPVDHPVRLLDELIESDAFASTFKEWANGYVLVEGQPPYHPKDLTKLYIYGLLNRIRSSRQLEAACYNRVDVIWLMSGQAPDHSTIAGFVTQHKKRLREFFRTVLQVGIRARLVSLNHACVDGSKIEAQAGRGSVKTEETIRKELHEVDEKIAQLEAQWENNEKQETNMFGDSTPCAPDGQGDPKKRLAKVKEQQKRMREALKSIERRQEEAGREKPRPIASVTDPDSRVMPGKSGPSRPNYNVQIAVETQSGMIVAADVNDQPDDCGSLTPMVRQTEENCGQKPKEVSADSAYNSGKELRALEEEGVKSYVPDRKTSGKAMTPQQAQAVEATHSGEPISEEQWAALPKDKAGIVKPVAFGYDAEGDQYRCPMGQALPYQRRVSGGGRHGSRKARLYGGCPACAGCPRASGCYKAPAKGRTILRDEFEPYRERARQRISSADGRQKYKLRSQTVEPKFGYIKSGLGIRRFLRRGIERVKTEWIVICTAVNVGILLRNWKGVCQVI
jgi:transposase